MKSQFKNPLQGSRQPITQRQAWPNAGEQPAAPGDLSQENLSSVAQKAAYADGVSLASSPPNVRTSRPRETPYPSDLSIEEQPTVKRPALEKSQPLNGPGVQVPNAFPYVQGQTERRAPSPGMQVLAPDPNRQASAVSPPMLNPQIAMPRQQAGLSIGASPFSPDANAFNQDGSVGPVLSGAVLIGTAGTLNPTYSPSPSAQVLSPPSLDYRRASDGPPPKRGSGGQRRKRKRKVPLWSRVVIGILLVLLILGGGSFAYYEYTFAGAVNNIVGQQFQRYNGEGNPNANLNGNILSGPRINILLLGSDTDEKFAGDYLAQTDIVITIDPATKAVGMLSIPRDSFISVPGYGMHKLDEAYGLGGVSLSRLTIEQDFGITINYTAWVGLDGFIKVINTLGGVDVDVTHPIVDDNYPDDIHSSGDPFALERLYISPGPQHLDGVDALEYVRSRHADLVGDFGRSARQQQVLTALKSKLNNPDIFSKLSTIANELNGSVKTDMQLPDILKLMAFARDLDINKVQKLILGPPSYSSTGVAPAGSGPDSGASVVFPNCSAIDTALQSMFQLSNSYPCQIGAVGGASHNAVAATTKQSSPLAASIANSSSDSGQSAGALLGNSAAGLMDGPYDLFGVHSLLDLMFLVAFEAPEALQI